MTVYLDSSALFKLYVKEAQSEEVMRYVRGTRSRLPCSQLHELEVKNAIRVKSLRKELTDLQVQVSIRLMDEDLTSGCLERTDFNWPDVFRAAEPISARFSSQIGCRALDLLHVASALLLEAGEFLTFDDRQRKLAVRAGLKQARI